MLVLVQFVQDSRLLGLLPIVRRPCSLAPIGSPTRWPEVAARLEAQRARLRAAAADARDAHDHRRLAVVSVCDLRNLVDREPRRAQGTRRAFRRHELEADIEPFKGLLLGLFFIAVGMSIDFGVLRQSPA